MNCLNCCLHYDENERIPRLLTQCGHSLCEKCLLLFFKDYGVQCPQCQSMNYASSLNAFPRNLALVSKSYNLEETCMKHSKRIEAFCEKDVTLLCVNCIIEDKHKNHNIETIQNASEKLLEGIKNSISISKGFKQEIYQYLNKNSQKVLQLKENSKKKKEEITKFCSNLIEMIKKRESEMINEVDSDFKNLDNKIYQSDIKLNEILDKLQNCMDLESYSSCSGFNILKNYNHITEKINSATKKIEFIDVNPILEKINYSNEFKDLMAIIKNEKTNRSKSKLLKETNRSGYNTIYVNKRQLKEKVKRNSKPDVSKATKNSKDKTKMMLEYESPPKKYESLKNSDYIHPSPKNLQLNLNKRYDSHFDNGDNKNSFIPSFQKRNLKLEKENEFGIFEKHFSDHNKSELSSIAFNEENSEVYEREMSKLDFSSLCKNQLSEIFVIGGYLQNSSVSVEKYCIESDKWEEYMKLPFNIVKYGSCVLDNGFITVIGGKIDGNRNNKIQIIDIHNKKIFDSGIKLLSAKSGFGFIGQGKEIFVIGGNDGSHILDEVEMYDLSTMKIKKLKPMLEKRDELSAAQGFDKKIYVIGGFGGSKKYNDDYFSKCLSSNEYYDLSSNTWNKLPDLNVRRRALSAVALPDGIYAIGGYDGEKYLSSVEKFDESINAWKNVASMNYPRCTFSSFVTSDFRFIYVLGGFNGEPLKSVERYSVVDDKWEIMQNMNYPRFMHCSVIVN